MRRRGAMTTMRMAMASPVPIAAACTGEVLPIK